MKPNPQRASLIQRKRSLQSQLAQLRLDKRQAAARFTEYIRSTKDRNWKTYHRNQKTASNASYDNRIQSLRQQIASVTSQIRNCR